MALYPAIGEYREAWCGKLYPLPPSFQIGCAIRREATVIMRAGATTGDCACDRVFAGYGTVTLVLQDYHDDNGGASYVEELIRYTSGERVCEFFSDMR